MKKDWSYKLVYTNGVIQKEPSEEVQSFIKLFSEVLELEFYPKEVLIDGIKFLDNKPLQPKNTIEYFPDTIYRLLKEVGFEIPFGWVLNYGMVEPQRDRENKYYYIDIKR